MVSEDGVVPEDRVVPVGRVVAGVGWLAGGVVEVDISSEVVGGDSVVGGVVVGPVVLLVDVELVGGGATNEDGLSPGFCHTDLVVASPVAGKSTSRSASAEPAEARATTAKMTVPAARRSACENRGAAWLVAACWFGRLWITAERAAGSV